MMLPRHTPLMPRGVLLFWLLLCSCTGHAGNQSTDAGSTGGMDSSMKPDGSNPSPDAAEPDSSVVGCKPFVPPADCALPQNGGLPTELRCTGLYSDTQTRSTACGVVPYTPSYALWSDGSVKSRYVSLPKDSKIDVSDPESFVYPVGTQFWKEFRLKTASGDTRLGETRIMRKVTENDWVYGTYVWNEAGTSTLKQDDGLMNLFGLGHDVPTRDQCLECHQGRRSIDGAIERPDLILGWDPILLGPGAAGVTWQSLREMNVLTSSSGAGIAGIVTQIPGAAVEQAALGYLHVNCGVSCHNSGTQAKGYQTGFFTRLDQGKLASVHDTSAVVTGIHNRPTTNLPQVIVAPMSGAFFDIRPGDLERSLLVNRMKRRDPGKMPNLGTNATDPDGISTVSAWIEAMTEERGYPAALP